MRILFLSRRFRVGSPRIRHRNKLTDRDWKKAVQGLGKCPIEYKMSLKILKKLRCLMAFQNRPSAPIGRDENFVYFEFLEGQFSRRKAFLCHLEEN